MQKDRISVIVPIYKVEPYLRKCLDSMVNQTYHNLEIILIDDGSPDNCGKICDEYAAKDDRVTVIHKKNEGLCAARNDGMRRATGEWLTFVDSDDWCEVDYYENLISANDNTADVIFAGGYYVEYPNKRKEFHTPHKMCSYHDPEVIEDLRVRVMYGLPWDKLYRAEFICKNGLFFDEDVRSFEDFLFNFQALEKAQKVLFTSEIGYHYRQWTESIGHGFNPNKPELNAAFINKLYASAEKSGMTEKLAAGINAAVLSTIAVALNCYYFHPANPKSHAEIYGELNEMKNMPYYNKAIFSKSNRYLSKRQLVLKYALRMNPGGGYFVSSTWQNRSWRGNRPTSDPEIFLPCVLLK